MSSKAAYIGGARREVIVARERDNPPKAVRLINGQVR